VTDPGRRRRAGDLAPDRARQCRHAALDGLGADRRRPLPTDKVQVEEQVVPAVPVETWAATFLRIGPAPFPVAPPPGALPGRGSIDVALSDSPAPSLAGVRAYMRFYPYGCFEQRLSKAVALDDRAAWSAMMDDLPAYTDRNGLLRYWPGDYMRGSVALTAYALSITPEAGFEWPEERRKSCSRRSRPVVDGRLDDENEGPADMRLLRLAALAALARNGAATPAMVGQSAIPVADMPTAILADWLVTLDKVRGVAAKRRAAAEAACAAGSSTKAPASTWSTATSPPGG
jgi:hypothetical protein